MALFTRVSVAFQSLLYIASGVNHFWHVQFYKNIMPDHYANPERWIAFSGIAEILGGVGLLLPATRRASGWGLALMLIGFLDVHVYMLRHPERFPKVPAWVLWARLPLQGILIALALQAARHRRAVSQDLLTGA